MFCVVSLSCHDKDQCLEINFCVETTLCMKLSANILPTRDMFWTSWSFTIFVCFPIQNELIGSVKWSKSEVWVPFPKHRWKSAVLASE